MSKLSPAPKVKHRAQKRRFAHRRSSEYQTWVRQQTCLLLGHRRNEVERIMGLRNGQFLTFPIHACCAAVQVCHVRSRGAGGDDPGNIVPMCAGAHDEQHRIGIKSFQARWGIDLETEAARLYQGYLAERGRA